MNTKTQKQEKASSSPIMGKTNRPSPTNETDKRWYCFETCVRGQRKYIGKALTTFGAIKFAMPWSDIVGNLVTIYARPPEHAKRFAHIRKRSLAVIANQASTLTNLTEEK